jgi:hypothetical protein
MTTPPWRPATTTPQQRVYALLEAIANLRRGDLEAVLDLDFAAQGYPGGYEDWYDANWYEPEVDPHDDATAEHLRYFASRDDLEGISGHMLGRLWEYHLGDIMERAAERHPPPKLNPAPVPLRHLLPREDEAGRPIPRPGPLAHR